MLHCVSAPLRLASRRSRSLSLVTVLVTLIITQVILRRQSHVTLGDALKDAASHPSGAHPGPSAEDPPLQFYGAARHFSDQRRTLQAPPSSGRSAAASAVSAPTQTARADPAQATGHNPAEVSGHNHSRADGLAAAADSTFGERFLRWDRTVPEPGEDQQRPLSVRWLQNREQEQRERRETLAAACRWYNVTLAAPGGPHGGDTEGGLVEEIKASHLSSVPKLRALTCLVNKVASTSLLGTLLKVAGHGVPVYSLNNGHVFSPHAHAKVLRPEKPGELENAREEYTKILFVRHPMDRLISAYEDKVIRAPHKSLLLLREAIFSAHEHRFILDKSVELYSKHPENKDELSKAYYAELAEYKKEIQRRNNVPTFQEFLDFILNGNLTGDSFDSHWTPYWRQCAPCHMNYDIIGHLETGTIDFKYAWHRLGIYRSVAIPWLHGERRAPAALEGRLRTYLSPLRRDTIRQLRRLFRPDFHMFGYDWRAMLDASGHCHPGRECDLE